MSAPTTVLGERSGQIRAAGAQGALHADARVLSAAVLTVGGTEPVPLSAGLLGAERALFVGACRELGDDIPDPTVRVERERLVGPGRVSERIRLISRAESPVVTEVTLRVAADLAGLGEIKAGRAVPAVPISVPGGSAAGLVGSAGPGEPGAGPGESGAGPGEPGAGPGESGATLGWGPGPLRVRLSAPGGTVVAQPGGAALVRWPVRLAERGELDIGWELTVTDPDAVVVAAPHLSARDDTWAGVRAAGDDPRLPRLLHQALADAAALRMATARAPGDMFLAGGAPWYLTLFGRDSIWAARLMLPFGWQLAAGTLRALAGLQGRRLDAATGEAPGKIPHELRTAGRQAGGLPSLYYGTIDATPLWVCLLHDAWRWGMPAGQVRALLPGLTAALAYLRDYGDADGDGFLEYIDESGRGLANQGWKDSGDAIRFADGAIAAPPVALCEVQAYAYEAASRGADLLDAFGEPGAQEWRAWAARLADAFRAAFWVSDGDGPYPALALDAAKRPVDSLTSNIGHLLGTGLLTPAEEDLVAGRLASPALHSGFGLRTMSAASGGYSPLSYHCGSVWCHDTAIVIRGLAVSGHAALAASLAGGLLDVGEAYGWRLPELFAGDARTRVPWPSPYPASCSPQAWAAASAGVLVQALLGLDADVPGGRVSIAPPRPDGGAGSAGAVGLAGAGGAEGMAGAAGLAGAEGAEGMAGARAAGAARASGGAGVSGPAGRAVVAGLRAPRLHVEGLVAGGETFSAGIDGEGAGYLRGLSPALRGAG